MQDFYLERTIGGEVVDRVIGRFHLAEQKAIIREVAETLMKHALSYAEGEEMLTLVIRELLKQGRDAKITLDYMS